MVKKRRDGAEEFVPEEIVTEILLRSPVKSLLRFKTVSKSYYSIINCKVFIKKHLNLANASRHNRHNNFVGFLIPDKEHPDPCLVYQEDSDGIIHAKRFNCPRIDVRVCNTCDGLICLVTSKGHKIFVWNPSFPEEYRIISSRPILESKSVAMGYDPSSDDYKIIEVFNEELSAMAHDYLSLEILSLKSNSWRSKRIPLRNSISYFPRSLICVKNGVYLKGLDEDDDYKPCLLYFDFAEESLDYINFPSNPPLIDKIVTKYKDSIAIGFKNSQGQREVWVVEEYRGMNSLWKKVLCFDFIDPFQFGRFSFSFTSNGQVLVRTSQCRLGKCDEKDASFEHVVVHGDNITYMEEDPSYPYYFFASTYVESLLSPRQLQQQLQQLPN